MLATDRVFIPPAGFSAGSDHPTPLPSKGWRWVLLLLCVGPLFAQQPRTGIRQFPELAAGANAARSANRLDHAAALYQQALALRPDWAQGWWYLGTIDYDENAYAQAAHAFQRLITLQ